MEQEEKGEKDSSNRQLTLSRKSMDFMFIEGKFSKQISLNMIGIHFSLTGKSELGGSTPLQSCQDPRFLLTCCSAILNKQQPLACLNGCSNSHNTDPPASGKRKESREAIFPHLFSGMAHRFAHITSIHTHRADFSLLAISRCKKSCNIGSLMTPSQLLMSLWDNHLSHILGPILERIIFIFLRAISAVSSPSSQFCKNKDITSTNFLRLMISRDLFLFSCGRNNKAGLCSTGLPS